MKLRFLFLLLVVSVPGAILALPGLDAVLVIDCVAAPQEQEIGKTISGIMVSAVSGAPGLVAVSPESRARALEELDFSLSGLVDPASLVRIGRMTQATSILSGKLFVDSGFWYLTFSRVDVATGLIIASTSEVYRSAATAVEGAAGQIGRTLGLLGSVDDRRMITVSNMTELLQAIGPDRIIRIKAGNYDLSQGFLVKNKYINWVNEYDGPCPVIKSVSNLSLVGEGDPVIMVKPAYGWVFSFETCTGLRLSGITFGHTVPGQCLGGVIRLRNCDDVELQSCELYGSGTYGLGLERSSNVLVQDCLIRDCSYGLATIDRCSQLSFVDSVFRHTGEFDLISIAASDHLLWLGCRFSDNWGDSLFSLDAESRDIELRNCSFADNRVQVFADRPEALRITTVP